MLVAGLDVRIVNDDGELPRALTLPIEQALPAAQGADEVQGCPETGVNDVLETSLFVEVGVREFTR